MTSLASTGMATGRLMAGSLTTTAAITQLLPYPVFAGPGADAVMEPRRRPHLLAAPSEQGVVDRDDHRVPGGH